MRDLKSPKTNRVKGNRRKKAASSRNWRRRLRYALRLTVFAGSTALVVSGGWLAARLVFTADYFRIAEVRVENLQRVSRDEVLALSDIRKGESIFSLDLESIGRKIEENPWIASARVQRLFPREVVIRVSVRQPRAIVNLGYLYYADARGELFKLLDVGDELDFPVITGLDREFLLDNPQTARGLLRRAMVLLEELGSRDRFGKEEVSEIHIDRQEGLILYTCTGGVPVRLGSGGYAAKLDRLEHIYPELESRLSVLRYIDLNVENRVIVKVASREPVRRG